MKKITVKDLAKCCCMNCHHNNGLIYGEYESRYCIRNNETVFVPCEQILYFGAPAVIQFIAIRKTCKDYKQHEGVVVRVPHEIYRELKR